MLNEFFKRMLDKNIVLTVTERFKDLLVQEGYNPSYGARPLRRAIMRLLEDSLAEEILTGKVREGASVQVDVDDDGKVKVIEQETLSGSENNLQLLPSA